MAKKSKPLRSFVAYVSVIGRAEVYFDAVDEEGARAIARRLDFPPDATDRLIEWEYDSFTNVKSND